MTSITAPPTELPFELGKPQSFQGLGLIPLFSRDEPALEYIGLDEAAAAGLVVTEIDQSGSVGTLAVSNPLEAQRPPLRGRRADRRQAEPRARAPRFSCTRSRSRPSPSTASSAVAGRIAASGSRRRHARRIRSCAHEPRGRAGRVWAEISAKSARLDAASPTDAVEADLLQTRSSLDEYLAALPRQEGQCGAIVCVGGRVVCLDYVSRSEVYAGLYAKLLRGYALDAVEQPGRRARARGLRATAGQADRPRGAWARNAAGARASTATSLDAASPAPSSSSVTRSSPSASSATEVAA